PPMARYPQDSMTPGSCEVEARRAGELRSRARSGRAHPTSGGRAVSDLGVATPREPWVAVICSSILSGLGQYYCGRRGRAVLFLVFGAGVLVAALTLFLLPTGGIKIALFALLIGLAIHLFGIFDAYACAKRANTKEFEEDRSKDPDPWRAAFLSALLP